MQRLLRPLALGIAVCLGLLAAAPALAGGPYGDELAKCMVRSTTQADKTLLVQWMFVMIALHPDVERLANISDADRTDVSKRTAAMVESLLTRSCVSETRDAIKYEGNGALEGSFSVLGQVAARELFSKPEVAKGLAEIGTYLDSDKIKKALEPEK
jgi:hypothetical protein